MTWRHSKKVHQSQTCGMSCDPSHDDNDKSKHLYLLSMQGFQLLLIPEFCPGGQRQRLTVKNSILLVENDSKKGIKANRKPAFDARTLHPADLTVFCPLIRFSWHGASCPCEILRFSTVFLPEVQKKRGADVDFQTGWAHVSNQAHQVSPRGVSDWWRVSVRKSVSVHQDKIRGSAIHV